MSYSEDLIVRCSSGSDKGCGFRWNALQGVSGERGRVDQREGDSGWAPKMDIRNAAWELVDRTMGIVGLGGTGRELAIPASAFGLRVIAVDPEKMSFPQCVETCFGMDCFREFLVDSDILAIYALLTPQTSGLFDDAFRMMRSHALLINVTRGGIMNNEALVRALNEGEIGGAVWT